MKINNNIMFYISVRMDEKILISYTHELIIVSKYIILLISAKIFKNVNT